MITADMRLVVHRYLGPIAGQLPDHEVMRAYKAIVEARRNQANKTAEAVTHTPDEDRAVHSDMRSLRARLAGK